MASWLTNPYFQPEDDPEVVFAGLRRIVDQLGLDHFCFRLVRPARHARLNLDAGGASFPGEWMTRYEKRRYFLVDPVREQALYSNRPFYWGLSGFANSLKQQRRQVVLSARSYRINCGLAIPVHSANGSVGIVNFTSSSAQSLLASTRHEHDRLLAVAFDAHDFMLNSEVDRTESLFSLESTNGLSIRERECLLWTLEGKTAEEVSEILCISVHTVNRHASKAAQKLGCASKHHAAIRAMRAGII